MGHNAKRKRFLRLQPLAFDCLSEIFEAYKMLKTLFKRIFAIVEREQAWALHVLVISDTIVNLTCFSLITDVKVLSRNYFADATFV